MGRQNKPKFKVGEKVLFMQDFMNHDDKIYSDCKFMNFLDQHFGVALEIRNLTSVNGSRAYFVKGFYGLIPERCLRKAPKPKFKEGDWVKLKKDIISVKEALEAINRSKFPVVYFDKDMLLWQCRFMKIERIHLMPHGSIYCVKENGIGWYEAWLDKVE
jgi:hypothetical protein